MSRRRVALALFGAMFGSTMFGLAKLQRAMIYPRGFAQPVARALQTPGLERWWLDSDEGPVEAWVLPGAGVSEAAPGPAVIFTHGNGELIDHWPHALQRYRDLGMTVVLPEYRGYGRSAGEPCEAAIRSDLLMLYSRFERDRRFDVDRLVYHGRSLGGGAACTLVDAHPPRALILESTFTSIVDVAAAMFVPAFLMVERFENRPVVERYSGPLLVFHGQRDQVIDVAHGRRLAGAHRNAELVLYDAGHNDFPPPGADYWDRIERFLRKSEVLEAP